MISFKLDFILRLEDVQKMLKLRRRDLRNLKIRLQIYTKFLKNLVKKVASSENMMFLRKKKHCRYRNNINSSLNSRIMNSKIKLKF